MEKFSNIVCNTEDTSVAHLRFARMQGHSSSIRCGGSLCNSYGFSLLENPSRSNPLLALLCSRIARFSLPKFRSFAAHSYGFSLAEAMVMLVIVAILMAVSAPLIAKKATADSKRLWLLNGANIVGAMGGNQNVGIGIQNPNDAKLSVQSTNANQSLIAKFQSIFTVDTGNADEKAANAKQVIFQVSPKSDDAYITANGNPNGFMVYADGTTNIAACVPDFEEIYNKSGDNSGKVKEDYKVNPGGTGTDSSKSITADGYYALRSRCVYLLPPNVTLGSEGDENTIKICPPLYTTVDGNSNSNSHLSTTGTFYFFPVNAGQTIKYPKNGTSGNYAFSKDLDDINIGSEKFDIFIPCKKSR